MSSEIQEELKWNNDMKTTVESLGFLKWSLRLKIDYFEIFDTEGTKLTQKFDTSITDTMTQLNIMSLR